MTFKNLSVMPLNLLYLMLFESQNFELSVYFNKEILLFNKQNLKPQLRLPQLHLLFFQ